MELTGKAKEDFEFWLFNRNHPEEYYNRELISKTCLNALIIEWFDSVDYLENTSLWEYCFEHEYSNKLGTYKFIIEQAIIKANDIYNERLK
ncbi:hypothetical protein F0358_10675 [Empedobacter brevis]|uniref:hypothetical protein n=1 Tax=Empedobacter brevis TaxID=247 RepID=UPI00123DC098|nr:hypothetical protein [Empedobacter brevis]QES93138.1 hypothetical protein F0358_10675 [Empedobacter brevis]